MNIKQKGLHKQMEPRLMDVLQGKEDNYILPFLWQHGESKELLEEGMQRIYDSGIKAVCVESRPVERFGYNYGKGKGIKYACLGFR